METAYFREQAVVCRRYARLVGDNDLRIRMLALALEFDEQADQAEERTMAAGLPSAVVSGRS
jgi:hypothetical protein